MNQIPYITPGHLIDSKYCGRYDYGVICFRGHHSSTLIVETLGANKIQDNIFYCTRSENVIPAAYEMQVNGKNIVIITGAAFGGPQAAIYVEEMKYLGVNAIIGVMIAAGVSPEFGLGEFFYVDEVICLDGVSTTYYECNEIISTSFCHEEILSIARDLGIELKSARAASVDAIYHETPKIINHLKELDVDVMNLDIAPFITTAKLRGVDAIMFGYISDRFEADQWVSSNWDRNAANETSADMLARLMNVITSK
ncbi:MAG: hypothetical protein GY832_01170 [Chloroflexi bacterium]|nr:hypothetical protein [Chloroflexota bacterium]